MNQKENLQNMVLDILSPDSKDQDTGESLEDLLERQFNPNEVLAKARDAAIVLDNNPSEELVLKTVSNLSVIINQTHTGNHYRSSRLAPGHKLSILLLEYLRKEIEFKDLLFWIIQYADELELRLLTSDNRRRMAYLEDVWKEETAEQLAEILQTKKATVERWLAGNNPSSSNASSMDQIINILFRLNKRSKMTEEDALEWFNSNNGNLGDSPRNILKNSSRYWGMPPNLREELQRIGAYN